VRIATTVLFTVLGALGALGAAGAACGKADKPAGGTAEPTPPATPAVPAPGSGAHNPALDKLVVTTDGKPVAMERAFIKRVSPDQWRVQVGDLEGSCEELLSGVTSRKPGATSFVASIGRRVRPDGSDTIVVTDFWSAGHPTDSATSTAAISGTADRGSQTFVALGKITDLDKTRKLEINGSFTAVGCGDQAAPIVGLPKAPHPSTATVTVAGKRLPIAGAIRSGDVIVITSGPRDCSPPTVPAQVIIEHRAGRWELTGTWFAEPSTSTDNALGDEARTKELKLIAGAIGKGPDGPTVSLAIAGTGKLGDYPVTFDGTIEALDCPR
jgi:hypothetical protein